MRIFVVALMVLVACGTAFAAAPAKITTLPPAPEGVIIEQNLEYLSPGREEKLDLYRPANPEPGKRMPGVVMIHGGGWVGGDKAAAREYNIGTTLAKAGYVVVSVNYQMEAGRRWPTNLHDCKNGVRFLRHHADKYQVDPEHIGVIGGSAGGHLALMVAYTTDIPGLEPDGPYPDQSSRVSAVVDLYGITNVATRRKPDKTGAPTGEPSKKSALVTATADEDPELWKLISPVTHVKKDSPPTLILHGTADTTVDRDQATELADKLKSVGAKYEIIMLEGIGHTFDLQSWRKKPLPQDLRPVVVGFFDKHLKRN